MIHSTLVVLIAMARRHDFLVQHAVGNQSDFFSFTVGATGPIVDGDYLASTSLLNSSRATGANLASRRA
jgi:hypothetical protein